MYQKLSDALPLLLAVVFAVCLSITLATRQCDYTGRPHPRGFCGQRLATIRQNLCTVLRHNYPQYYPSASSSSSGEKRSESTNHTEPVKFSKVLHMLQHALEPVEQEESLEKRRMSSEPNLYSGPVENLPHYRHITLESFEFWPYPKILSGLLHPEDTMKEAKWLDELLRGRTKREVKRVSGPALVRRKRDLVCDCCYNQCTIHQVALYC